MARLRTKAAAEYSGLTKSTLEKFRLTGGGPAYIKIVHTVIYDTDDLDAFLAAHRRQSTAEY
jgi:hypothetical protein